MEFVKKIFIPFDTFRTPINIFFLSREKISTTTNLVLSFLIYAILFASFIKSDFWMKRSPKISDQIIDSGPTSILLDRSKFGFNFFLADDFDYYTSIDPSYFNIKVVQAYYIEKNDDFYTKEIPFENCKVPNYQGDNYYEYGFCLTNDTNIFLNVSDKMWDGDYAYLVITLNYCRNDSNSSIICQPLPKIRDFLDGKSFTIIYNDYSFNMRDLDHPVSTDYVNSKPYVINKDFYQFYSYEIGEVEIYEDQNSIIETGDVLFGRFIREDPKSHFTFYNKEMADNTTNSESLLKIAIYPSRNKREIIRKYQKLTEALSSLGGLLTILKFLMGFVAKFSIESETIKLIFENLLPKKKLNLKKKELLDFSSSQNRKLSLNKDDTIACEKKNIHFQNMSFSIDMKQRNRKDMNMESDLILAKIIEESEKNSQKMEIINPANANQLNKSWGFENSCIKGKNPKLSHWEILKFKIKKLIKIKFNSKELEIEDSLKFYQKEFDLAYILKKIISLKSLKMNVFNRREIDYSTRKNQIPFSQTIELQEGSVIHK